MSLALGIACTSSNTASSPASGCNLDSDCTSVDEVCRAHKCVNKNSSPSDQPDGSVAGDAASPVDASNDVVDDPFATCTVVEITPRREPLVMEIVLDGSGSMDSDNKWLAARAGLNAFFDELGQSPPNALALGMIVFEDQLDSTNGLGPYPSPADVYPQLVTTAGHLDALKKRVNDTGTRGGTPTKLAMNGAYSVLRAFAPPAGSPVSNAHKAAVLISDGIPNGGSTEQAETIALAQSVFAMAPPDGPMRTYAVGVGFFPTTSQFSYDTKFMGDLAVAGGTRAFPACDPAATVEQKFCHFQVTPSASIADMKQAFLTAARRASVLGTACELPIDDTTAFDPSRARVKFVDAAGKTTIVPNDADDGWTFDDDSSPTKLVFNGPTCPNAAKVTEIHLEACTP